MTILENTGQRVTFEVTGYWPGVSSFVRSVTVTPEGYTARVVATYDGTPTMAWTLYQAGDALEAGHEILDCSVSAL